MEFFLVVLVDHYVLVVRAEEQARKNPSPGAREMGYSGFV
jgi:hypothetical protein